MSSDSARMEVVQCERDIQSIKAALRQVSSDDENQPNSLEVIWTGMEGMEFDDSMEATLQLSSPVEELTLKKIRPEGDDAVEGSSVTFEGVESSMATLTVTLKKDGKVLGTSEAFDMAPICSMGDAMNPKETYVTPLPVAIVAPEDEAKKEEEKPAEEESKPEAEEDKPATEEGDKPSAEESSDDKKEQEDKKDGPTLIKPLCTIALRMVFKPSAKDLKEALYELLNKASLRRSQALDRHRGEQRSAMTAASGGNSPGNNKKEPAVKAGFLNKKNKKDEDSKLMQFYNKWLGPKSLTRVIVPIAKNYVIFFGAIVMMHFKGQELSLPAPV